jgi:hypothetical protein
MSEFETLPLQQEGLLKIDNDQPNQEVENYILDNLNGLDQELLKDLANKLGYGNDWHEKCWVNAFVNVGWGKSF